MESELTDEPYVHVDARCTEAWGYHRDQYHVGLFQESAKNKGGGALLIMQRNAKLTNQFLTLIRTPSVAKHF